jgi:hypothetical protein
MNLKLSAQDTEELLRSVTSVQETNNKPHQAVRDRAVSLERQIVTSFANGKKNRKEGRRQN